MFYKSKIIIFEFKQTEDKLSRLRDLVQHSVYTMRVSEQFESFRARWQRQ